MMDWIEVTNQKSLPKQNGIYNVKLDSKEETKAYFWNDYLDISVRNTGHGTYFQRFDDRRFLFTNEHIEGNPKIKRSNSVIHWQKPKPNEKEDGTHEQQV